MDARELQEESYYMEELFTGVYSVPCLECGNMNEVERSDVNPTCTRCGTHLEPDVESEEEWED